jgi:hypothetical protein
VKAVDVKPFAATGGDAHHVFVMVPTDKGISGVGECMLESKELAVLGAIEECNRTVRGRLDRVKPRSGATVRWPEPDLDRPGRRPESTSPVDRANNERARRPTCRHALWSRATVVPTLGERSYWSGQPNSLAFARSVASGSGSRLAMPPATLLTTSATVNG